MVNWDQFCVADYQDSAQHDVMVKIAGKTFRCDCGCNVFRSPKPSIFVCNGCGARWIGS